MTVIQVILIVSILLLIVYAYRKFRTSYLDAVFILAILIAGIVLVIAPELSNKIAHVLGIGRGADMVFYLSNVFFLFIILKLYAKVRKLEAMMTGKFREKAIEESSRQEEKR